MQFCGLLTVFLSAAPVSSYGQYIIPVIADGKFADGTSYKTTVTVLASSSTGRRICELRFSGFTSPPQMTLRDNTVVSASGSSYIFSFGPDELQVVKTTASRAYQGGFANLDCSGELLLYFATFSLHDAAGNKIGEAPIPLPTTNYLYTGMEMTIDQREGEHVGIALLSPSIGSYTIRVTDAQGKLVGQAPVSLTANRPVTRFVDEFVQLPQGFIGKVSVSDPTLANKGFYAFALRFAGNSFTTLPLSACDALRSFNPVCP